MYRLVSISIAVVLVLVLSTTASGEATDGHNVVETPSGVVVTAGAPGSLSLSFEPGQTGGGVIIFCGWYHFSVEFGVYLFDPLGVAILPQIDSTYFVNCWTDDRGVSYPGYPMITRYEGSSKIPGSVVSSADAARFAIAHIGFELPEIELSPPQQQVVGIPTWLAVTSQLQYDEVSANAGPVWATVRAEFSHVTWDFDNADPSLICTHDVAKVWDANTTQPQSSRCSYTYTNSTESPFDVKATVRWNIWQKTNTNPNWHRWGTISRSSTVSVRVTQLQAAIR